MKKIIFTFLALSVSILNAVETIPNAIDALVDGPHIHIHHLGKHDRNAALIDITFLTIYGGIFGSAIKNIQQMEINYNAEFHPEKENILQTIFGDRLLGKGLFCASPIIIGAIRYLMCAPHLYWSQQERDIVDITLTHDNQTELLQALHEYFARYKEETSVGFYKLSHISKRLTRAKEIFVHTKNDRYKELIAVLTSNITAVNKALVLIKNQPKWEKQMRSNPASYLEERYANNTQDFCS